MKQAMGSLVANVLKPTFRRLGSLLAGGLVSLGMAAPAAAQVELAILALLAFGVDLVASNWARKG